MELRLCLVLALAIGCFVKCSEARHSVARRSNDVNYVDDEAGDDLLADAASDDDTQNDAEGGDEEEEVEDAIIITQSTNYSVDLGSNVRLACQVSPSVGVVVQWRRGTVKYFLGTMKPTEQLLQTYGIDERFSIAPNSTDLLIRDVQPDDSGVYSCEILQENLPSIHHRVAVLESPRIREFIATDNGRVTEGADLVLTCDVTGSPPPKIVWSRDGPNGNERLHERDGEFFNNSVLIRNVNRQHTGKYYCYAFNPIGSNQAEVNVHVKGKPRVHVHRTVVNSAVNVEAVLQCAVHDDSDVRIRWYKDGQLVSNTGAYAVVSAGSRSNLTVIPESDAHFGTYTCEAENDLGKHNRSIDLVQSPVVENLDADGPKLSWTIHSHQPLRQIEIQLRQAGGEGEWRTITVPLPEERRHVYNQVYLLEDVESGKYEATVRVQNDKSWSHSDSALFDIVYRGGSDSLRPTMLALTTLIYLLVRM
ncbi:MAM domain-containing glycosylphosphatidylinositol anchor protein 2-like isoform X2 [Aricia agestis]|uniref:MAM domain-containing glycosylphosphatidylinositol anchor protein 2-like isoform X2 n=1 Tax=Aricia agestis TaxID=91739 RepID=UPI001C206300|nr:MAM domain-containing glycosylphosphatidylinositol anchor protein 2-like isoform X2 [Aricia agestis]